MAEALLNATDSTHFETTSVGLEAGQIHPFTVDVMKDIGIDLADKRTKTTREVAHRSFDFVITLCPRAKKECPEFEGAEVIHWQFEEPAGTDAARQKRMFASLRDQISQRIRLFALVQVRFTEVHTLAHHASKVEGHRNVPMTA
jgi:protein-tyrosine-phosphatase